MTKTKERRVALRTAGSGRRGLAVTKGVKSSVPFLCPATPYRHRKSAQGTERKRFSVAPSCKRVRKLLILIAIHVYDREERIYAIPAKGEGLPTGYNTRFVKKSKRQIRIFG